MKSQQLIKAGRIFLSFMFSFSAISKLISMPFFDGMVAELFLGEDYFNKPGAMFWVQLLVRILVAAELVLGVALLQNKGFKKWVLPATMLMLLLFTIHLFYEGFSKPNGFTEGNCGCFGDVLPMNNLESILKNIAAMVVGIFVWMSYKDHNRFASWVSPLLVGLVTMFTLSFGIKSFEPSEATSEITAFEQTTDLDTNTTAPMPEDEVVEETIEKLKGDEASKSLASEGAKKDVQVEAPAKSEPAAAPKPSSNKTMDLLYQYAPAIQKVDLTRGNKLVCLFSMTCSHCQETFADFCAMKSSGKLPQLYLVNYGTEYEQKYFFSQAGNCKDNHSLIQNYPDFKRMLEGETYPRILYFKDGKIVKSWNVDTYQKEDFMKYFGIEAIAEPKKSGGLELELGDSPW
jgi:hypothetical protein